MHAPPDIESQRRLLRHARREAGMVLLCWALFLVWTVGYSYLRGYAHAPESAVVELGLAAAGDADDFRTVLGLPDWVFWGIALPWLIATGFTVYFALRVIRDDDLGGNSASSPGES